MSDELAQSEDLVIRVELRDLLSTEISGVSARLSEAIGNGIRDLAATLGIPVRLSVIVASGRARGSAISVNAGDVRVRYPDDLLQHVYSYVIEQPLDLNATPDAIVRWLLAGLTDLNGDRLAECAELLAQACVEVLKRQPSVLFGPVQARAYLATLPVASVGPWVRNPADSDSSSVVDALRQVLDLGISIADRQAVAEVLTSRSSTHGSVTALAEQLVVALRPNVVEILAPRAFLEEVTMTGGPDSAGVFRFLRESMYEELGIELPRLRLVPHNGLKPRSFAFRFNHLVSHPLRGLEPHQLLVNDTVKRLALVQIDAIETANPATGQPASLVDSRHDAALQAMNLTTWNQIQHLVLCLADYVRQHGYELVDRAWVQAQLQKAEWVIPTLIEAVKEARWSEDEITALLRDLVREGVSIRNLKAILDRLLELSALRHEAAYAGVAVPEQELGDSLAFLRLGRGLDIADKASRQTNTVVVYLLDPEIEGRVVRSAHDVNAGDDLMEAVRAEFAQLPPTATRPHILTPLKARRAVQAIIRAEYPRISVLAHEELPRRTNVQPVARITPTAG